jgi:tetratricopeptide (TPR) repeat protein
MNTPKRNRARILTPEGLKKLREQIRSQETEENAGTKYTLEKLGELTGLDPETVKNVLDCKGSDKRTIARCFESFGLTLAESDHIPAAQAAVASPDPNFVGREGAIADLDTLVSRNAKVIVIQARGGVGKTTLARKYLQQSFDSFLEFPIAKETKDIASIEGLIEEKLRQLGEEPGREFLVSLDRLKRKLQTERIGILIDNLEPALDSAGRFIEAHRRYVELLRVLSDPTVQSVTLITSRERLREADVTVQHYPLRSLDVTAWSQFFQSRSIQLTPLAFPGKGVGGEGALAALHNAYGGNAKAMDIISGAVLEDFAGNVEAYWQANQADLFIERDLEDLVIKQFERLQQFDPDAYNLLCRMGCYRYQDVPAIPIEGLFCLLWDVPENRHRRVIKSLQDRSLVDFEEGEFWLHPAIRAESISRLRRCIYWESANRKAGEFWTEIIEEIQIKEDAKKALESYYHYIEIRDFAQAANILIKNRKIKWSDWKKGEPLGRSLYKLGFFKETISAIVAIIEEISIGYPLCRLTNILGDLYWLTGDIHKAIKCHQESRKMVNIILEESKYFGDNEKRELEKLRTMSFFNEAICQIDLWEVEKAIELLKKSMLESDSIRFYKLNARASYCLAFLLSTSDLKAEARKILEDKLHLISTSDWGVWSRSYSLFFLGLTHKHLKNLDESLGAYNQAIQCIGDSTYFTMKGRVLTGLAELYRLKSEFGKALEYHLGAIAILEKIGVKCDLSEAYYQRGLTYKTMGELVKSCEDFQEAIRLFSEIEAPKQVERVRQSMQN